MAPKANKAAEAEKKRKALAQRQQEAEEAFTRADEDGSGSVDATELKRLLTGLLQREGVAFDSNIVGEFVNAEYAKADSDGSGDVDFDEFITYYNLLVDRLAGGGMKDALEQAKQRTAEKLEEQAVAEDPAVYEHLHTLAAILSNPSVQSYAGLNVPFNLKEKGTFGNLNPEHAPRSEEGASSRGLILDLSRRAQRLLTPWGSLPFGYRLSFEGYQEKLQTEEEAAAKSKSKAKKQQAATLVPAGTSATEKFSMFLTLCVPGASTLLQLRRIPLRCHFQVTAIDGKPLPCGEVIGVTGDAAKAKLSTRFMNLIKAYPKDPVPPLPPDDGDKGPLINVLMGETVAVRPDRLDNLKKRKEVSGRTGNKRFPEEDLALSMIICHNADADAAKLLVKMQGSENNVLDRRKGHATREMVRYALHTCGSEYDQTHLDHAEWMLKNQDKLLKNGADKITGQRGFASGLGLPTRQEVEKMLVFKRGDEGPVLADLKRQWRFRIEAMTEIIAATEVEEMLTPDMAEQFAFARPPTIAEEKHVEDLYLSDEFKRDKAGTVRFLQDVGAVLKQAGVRQTTTREESELLLREFGGSEATIKFLTHVIELLDNAKKNGEPTRPDCMRYLRACSCEKESAEALMKDIWKLANPKAPKVNPKAKKDAPPPIHYSKECGFPTREEAEWALLGTRAEDKEGKPLSLPAAMDLLKRLQAFTEDDQFAAPLTRPDMQWALDPNRGNIYIKHKPMSHEQYQQGLTAPAMMLTDIKKLLDSAKEHSLTVTRTELYTAYEKFRFDADDGWRWLNGVGTLMMRRSELGIASREEVEHAMEFHELNDAKVIELFQECALLQKEKLDMGNPSRDEIKAYLTDAWDKSERVAVTKSCLTYYRELMSDDAQLMTLFGKTPGEADKKYLRLSVLRFDGDPQKSLDYLKKVAFLEQADGLGNPTRERIILELDKAAGKKETARQVLRDEYQAARSIELKEEYKRNKEKEKAAAEKAAAA